MIIRSGVAQALAAAVETTLVVDRVTGGTLLMFVRSGISQTLAAFETTSVVDRVTGGTLLMIIRSGVAQTTLVVDRVTG
ncbi:hypothetical protein DPMN_156109 [Dreissena polymorpha]|uniref:Uncharacterized protein n=1 Tax=Dreissena polymorpha TaxID=45954 RepID=A0A9D4FP63_DREPO|nr:hypothetical protein DPMN_156109 [Dreissena polymorpha]